MEFGSHIFTENLIIAPSVLVLTCDVKMTLHTVQILGLTFSHEIWENWISVLHGNCIYISKIDVRLVNYPNWTSITRVMVHFSGLPQVALF